MWVLVYPGGVDGFDIVWLGLAVVLDVASWGGGAYGNRGRMQALVLTRAGARTQPALLSPAPACPRQHGKSSPTAWSRCHGMAERAVSAPGPRSGSGCRRASAPVPGLDEVIDDGLRRALRDTQLHGQVPQADVLIPHHDDQRVAMARQERPPVRVPRAGARPVTGRSPLRSPCHGRHPLHRRPPAAPRAPR